MAIRPSVAWLIIDAREGQIVVARMKRVESGQRQWRGRNGTLYVRNDGLAGACAWWRTVTIGSCLGVAGNGRSTAQRFVRDGSDTHTLSD